MMHAKSRTGLNPLLFVILFAVFTSEPIFAQILKPSTFGKILKSTQEENGLTILSEGANIQVIVYRPATIRIRIFKTGFADSLSYAVVKGPEKTKFQISETQESIRLVTDSLELRISKDPVRLTFLNRKGEILSEDETFSTQWIGQKVTTYKKLQPGEKFIGLGEKTGSLNRFGNAYTNWNSDVPGYSIGQDPLYVSTPFFMGIHSKNLYGIFLDNTYKTEFNFGASNRRFSSFSAEAGEMNYYFFARSSVQGILEEYTSLTGKMPLPPFWSLGYQQCRWSYTPDKEVKRMAETFREKEIPADVIYLDIDYMDNFKVFTWHPKNFSKPKELLQDLKQLGFHTVVIIDPGVKVEKGYHAYEEGRAQDLFVKYSDGDFYQGEVWPSWSHFPDFTNPKTRIWWGEKFQGLVETGVRGFWNDMNEPATWGQRYPDNTMFNFEGEIGTHLRAHNIYGLQMSRSTYEGAKKLMKGERPFILTRAAFSGVQRYSAVWTGDNAANDDHILLGVRLLNSMGLAGIPFVGVDIGGFNGEKSSQDLFGRWISVGAFSPFFRAHSMRGTRENDPWSYGEHVEMISKAFIKWRYTLLPYLYSQFEESSTTGAPIQRSLVYKTPFDPKVYDWAFENQFLLGDALMIAPLKSNEQYIRVYFPETDWYDVYTDELLSAGSEKIVFAPLEKLPVFARAGSVVIQQNVVMHTTETPSDTLYLHVYNGMSGGSFNYYEDDGLTYNFENGDFFKRVIEFIPSKKQILLSKPIGKRNSQRKKVKVILHGFENIRAVKVGGKTLKTAEEFLPLPMRAMEEWSPVKNFLNLKGKKISTVIVDFQSDEFSISW
ncbi:MAG: glycoside hydrolase family 31 protein [Chloroherpetonaceae bacterium]|nr:glycoside hydrolase family 31 protein [Chloroherpetonaceae bacterium]